MPRLWRCIVRKTKALLESDGVGGCVTGGISGTLTLDGWKLAAETLTRLGLPAGLRKKLNVVYY